MARPKTLTKVLTEQLQAANAIASELNALDLRTMRGDLRDSVREARANVGELTYNLDQAIQAEAHSRPALRITG